MHFKSIIITIRSTVGICEYIYIYECDWLYCKLHNLQIIIDISIEFVLWIFDESMHVMYVRVNILYNRNLIILFMSRLYIYTVCYNLHNLVAIKW